MALFDRAIALFRAAMRMF